MLKYIGNGSFLPDVPARDLTEKEIKDRGLDKKVLIASGLYHESKSTKKKGVEDARN